MLRLGGLLIALTLAACAPRPEPATPALWRVDGPRGQTAWLFGTVHALPRPVAWRSGAVDKAFAEADRIVVEVGNLGDDKALADTFSTLAATPGLPPLSARVGAALRPALAALLKEADMKDDGFSGVETWAAALMLARAGDKGDESANGVDRAVIAAARAKPVVELEGAADQLGIFDRLPEKEQRDLLELVVGDPDEAGEAARVAASWRTGDMAPIEAETHRGLLADAELRAALFTGRNQAWADRIVAMLGRGEKPFVAVGAAHMAGAEGLPAMLTARGYRVTRVQ